jgi:heat shock protein HtpX
VYEQIASNKRRTWLLILGAFVLLAAIGWAFGLWIGDSLLGLGAALLIALLMSIGSYRYGDRVVLASARA